MGDLQEPFDQPTALSSELSGPASVLSKESVRSDLGVQPRTLRLEQFGALEFTPIKAARPSRSVINSSDRSVLGIPGFDDSEPRRRVIDPKRLESWVHEAGIELFGREGLQKLEQRLRDEQRLHTEQGEIRAISSEDNALLSFKHLTISRDQTAASDFERERLLALSGIPNRSATDSAIPPPAASATAIHVRTGASNPYSFDPPKTAPAVVQTLESLSLFRKYHIDSTSVAEAKINNMDGETGPPRIVPGNIGSTDIEARIPSPPISELKERIKQLEIEIENLRQPPSSAPDTTPTKTEPPVFQILNYIVGARTAFLGWPTWEATEGSPLTIKGNQPVGNVETLLHRKGNVAFVVQRWFAAGVMPNAKEVEKANKDGLNLPEPMPAFTRTVLISEEMKGAFTTFLRAAKDHFGEFEDFEPGQSLSSPYTFWYHCRKTQIVAGMPAEEQELMRLLTVWIEESYGGQYSEAEDLFQKGVVKSSMIPYLIAPGELFTWKEHGQHVVVFKAESWPRTKGPKVSSDSTNSSEEAWEIDAWAYRYDGKFWKSYGQLNVYYTHPPKEDAETAISMLRAIPLRFQSEEQRLSLEARGRTFWKCRRQRFVSYQMEDAEDQLSRVSNSISTGARLDTDSHQSLMKGT